MAINESPVKAPGHAKSSVVRCAASDANDASSGAFPDRFPQHLPQTKRVQLEWVISFERQPCQPDHLSRLDNGGVLLRIPPPPGCARTVRRIDDMYGLSLGMQ